MPGYKVKVIRNPASVEDRDLAKAYNIALNFLQEKGYKVKKVKMGVSPFAPTYKKVMIIQISPIPKEVPELVDLESQLQRRVGKKVGILLS